jgi:hypothetical protein
VLGSNGSLALSDEGFGVFFEGTDEGEDHLHAEVFGDGGSEGGEEVGFVRGYIEVGVFRGRRGEGEVEDRAGVGVCFGEGDM